MGFPSGGAERRGGQPFGNQRSGQPGLQLPGIDRSLQRFPRRYGIDDALQIQGRHGIVGGGHQGGWKYGRAGSGSGRRQSDALLPGHGSGGAMVFNRNHRMAQGSVRMGGFRIGLDRQASRCRLGRQGFPRRNVSRGEYITQGDEPPAGGGGCAFNHQGGRGRAGETHKQQDPDQDLGYLRKRPHAVQPFKGSAEFRFEDLPWTCGDTLIVDNQSEATVSSGCALRCTAPSMYIRVPEVELGQLPQAPS